MKNIYFLLIFTLLCVFSCQGEKQRLTSKIEQWYGKEILFPQDPIFTILGSDTITTFQQQYPYKILTYIDSIGCLGCKLNAANWLRLIHLCDSLCKDSVAFLFYFHPDDKKEAIWKLRTENFLYPVCFDDRDSLNKLNHFPADMNFQTFLLDQNNKVLAVGNPAYNPQVRDFYLRIIQGKTLQTDSEDKKIVTTVSLASTALSMGDFAWQEERQGIFRLKNTGEKPLVIQDVVTSCGCLTVDYSQEPVQPGKEAVLRMTYKADNPGYFSKVLTVYCNAENSPIKLRVSGNAE